MHADLRHAFDALILQARLFKDQLDDYQRQEREGVQGLQLDEPAMLESLAAANKELMRVSELLCWRARRPWICGWDQRSE